MSSLCVVVASIRPRFTMSMIPINCDLCKVTGRGVALYCKLARIAPVFLGGAVGPIPACSLFAGGLTKGVSPGTMNAKETPMRRTGLWMACLLALLLAGCANEQKTATPDPAPTLTPAPTATLSAAAAQENLALTPALELAPDVEAAMAAMDRLPSYRSDTATISARKPAPARSLPARSASRWSMCANRRRRSEF